MGPTMVAAGSAVLQQQGFVSVDCRWMCWSAWAHDAARMHVGPEQKTVACGEQSVQLNKGCAGGRGMLDLGATSMPGNSSAKSTSSSTWSISRVWEAERDLVRQKIDV